MFVKQWIIEFQRKEDLSTDESFDEYKDQNGNDKSFVVTNEEFVKLFACEWIQKHFRDTDLESEAPDKDLWDEYFYSNGESGLSQKDFYLLLETELTKEFRKLLQILGYTSDTTDESVLAIKYQNYDENTALSDLKPESIRKDITELQKEADVAVKINARQYWRFLAPYLICTENNIGKGSLWPFEKFANSIQPGEFDSMVLWNLGFYILLIFTGVITSLTTIAYNWYIGFTVSLIYWLALAFWGTRSTTTYKKGSSIWFTFALLSAFIGEWLVFNVFNIWTLKMNVNLYNPAEHWFYVKALVVNVAPPIVISVLVILKYKIGLLGAVALVFASLAIIGITGLIQPKILYDVGQCKDSNDGLGVLFSMIFEVAKVAASSDEDEDSAVADSGIDPCLIRKILAFVSASIGFIGLMFALGISNLRGYRDTVQSLVSAGSIIWFAYIFAAYPVNPIPFGDEDSDGPIYSSDWKWIPVLLGAFPVWAMDLFFVNDVALGIAGFVLVLFTVRFFKLLHDTVLEPFLEETEVLATLIYFGVLAFTAFNGQKWLTLYLKERAKLQRRFEPQKQEIVKAVRDLWFSMFPDKDDDANADPDLRNPVEVSPEFEEEKMTMRRRRGVSVSHKGTYI
jgi:hypothetical protein